MMDIQTIEATFSRSISIHGFAWIIMDIHRYPWISMGSVDEHGYVWYSMQDHFRIGFLSRAALIPLYLTRKLVGLLYRFLNMILSYQLVIETLREYHVVFGLFTNTTLSSRFSARNECDYIRVDNHGYPDFFQQESYLSTSSTSVDIYDYP